MNHSHSQLAHGISEGQPNWVGQDPFLWLLDATVAQLWLRKMRLGRYRRSGSDARDSQCVIKMSGRPDIQVLLNRAREHAAEVCVAHVPLVFASTAPGATGQSCAPAGTMTHVLRSEDGPKLVTFCHGCPLG